MLFELPIVFHSQGTPLIGRVFRNTASLQERQPAIISMGSWLTVKEQMATTYARRLAESGYTTFVFDFSGFGESRGDPRQAEIPSRKIGDIKAAVALLQTLAFVEQGSSGSVERARFQKHCRPVRPVEAQDRRAGFAGADVRP